MEKIQSWFVQFFLQPLANVTNKLPSWVRTLGFYLCGLSYFGVHFLTGAGVSMRYLVVFALSCVCIGGMLLCTMPAQLQPIRWRKTILLLWLGTGCFILLSGLLHNVDFLPEAVMTLVAFPVFYIVWNNADWKVLMKKLCILGAASFLIYLFVTIFFFPIPAKQYSGLYTNVNGAGEYLALVIVCFTVLLMIERRLLPIILYAVLEGVAVALVFYSGSRAGQLAALCGAAMAVLFRFWGAQEKEKILCTGKLLALVCSAVLFINVTVFIYQGGYSLKYHLFNQSTGPSQTVTDPTGDPTDPSETVNPSDPSASLPTEPSETLPPETLPPKVDGIGGFMGVASDKGNWADKTLSDITTGRSDIWAGYIKECNLFGHSARIPVPYRGRTTTNPHNTLIAFAYDYGVIAALLFLAVNLLSGILAIRFARKHKNEPWALFPLAIIVCYGAECMLETLVGIHYPIGTYYRLVMFPLFALMAGTSGKRKEN